MKKIETALAAAASASAAIVERLDGASVALDRLGRDEIAAALDRLDFSVRDLATRLDGATVDAARILDRFVAEVEAFQRRLAEPAAAASATLPLATVAALAPVEAAPTAPLAPVAATAPPEAIPVDAKVVSAREVTLFGDGYALYEGGVYRTGATATPEETVVLGDGPLASSEIRRMKRADLALLVAAKDPTAEGLATATKADLLARLAL